MSATPAVNALTTADPTPALAGTLGVSDLSIAVTVGINGRYYAATRNTSSTWILPNNAIQTPLANGAYDVTVCATDSTGKVAYDTASGELTINAAPLTASVAPVTPDPRNSAVGSMTIAFQTLAGGTVGGFDLADLILTRDGGGNLLTGAETLTTSNNITWTLGGLSGITAAAGTYTLTLTAAGSNIVDSDARRADCKCHRILVGGRHAAHA